MNFCAVLCGILCAVSSASCASLRLPRQMWPQQLENHHFHFPDPSFEADTPDRFNEVIDFPDAVTRPNGVGNPFGPGFRPRPSGGNQNRPTIDFGQRPNESNQNRPTIDFGQRPNESNQNRPTIDFGQRPNANRPATTTPVATTTTERGSTPRTFHLAPEGCNCPFTPQFNPVCGSDGNTYKNSGLLNCFRRCGIDVSQRRMGAC